MWDSHSSTAAEPGVSTMMGERAHSGCGQTVMAAAWGPGQTEQEGMGLGPKASSHGADKCLGSLALENLTDHRG